MRQDDYMTAAQTNGRMYLIKRPIKSSFIPILVELRAFASPFAILLSSWLICIVILLFTLIVVYMLRSRLPPYGVGFVCNAGIMAAVSSSLEMILFAFDLV